MSEERDEGTKDNEDEAKAADHDSGQEQEPKQAQEDSSSTWDTDEHSDAPGPFGTGSSTDPGRPEDDED